MAGVTSPDLIAADDDSDAFDPASAYATLRDSVQRALWKRENYDFLWADAAARTGEVDMVTMSLGFQQDTKTTYIYNGTTWKIWHTAQPIAYTPTWTNLSVSGATQLWTYTVAAGMVFVKGFITGNSTFISGNAYMTLPLPANGYITSAPNSGNDQALGTALLEDLGTQLYDGKITTRVVTSVVYAVVSAYGAAGTYTNVAAITNLIPFTWGTGDFITAQFMYVAD